MATVGTVARLMVELSAAGVAETGAAVRGVGTSAEHATAKLGLMKRFMGSFLGQQLIFGLISKAIQVVSTNIQDIGTKTNAWDADLTQLNAVLASTHGVAGETSKAAIDLANSMSRLTLFNNDAVLSTENLLLTFTAIGKDIFPQATTAALNMAQALKEDTKSAAIQLGKALQDPVLGMTALRRVGVNFSKAQIEVVKQLIATGQKAKAQALILKELQTEFGGSAVAAGTTMAGQLKILDNQIDLSKEAIGNALIPVLAQLFGKIAPLATQLGTSLPNALHTAGDFFNRYLKLPLLDVKDVVGAVFGALGTLIGGFVGAATQGNTLGQTSKNLHVVLQDIAVTIKNDVTPALLRVGIIAGMTAAALSAISTWIVQNKTALQFLAILVGVILADAFYDLAAGVVASTIAMLSNPVGLIVAGIYLLIAGIIMLVLHWKEVVEALGWVKDRLGDLAGAIGEFIGGVLGAVGNFTGKLIELYTWPYRTLWRFIGPFVVGFVKFVANFIGNLIGIVVRFNVGLLMVLTWPFRTFLAFILGFAPIVIGAVGRFLGFLMGKLGDLGGVIYRVVKGPLGYLLGSFGVLKDDLGNLAGWIGTFVGGAMQKFGKAWQGLSDLVGSIWHGIAAATQQGIDVVIGALNGFISAIDKIQIHIPAINVGPVHAAGLDWGGLGIPSIPLLAQGGTVGRGSSAVFNEGGPEMLTVDSSGVAHVMPMLPPARDLSKTRASGGETHYHVHVNASQATAAEVMVRMKKQELLHRGWVR